MLSEKLIEIISSDESINRGSDSGNNHWDDNDKTSADQSDKTLEESDHTIKANWIQITTGWPFNKQ